ncbi:hypothetical protein BKA65DRAFT_485024 [Rhexocercosporidium sp. MPI-PUGE-AT-0058]|nr:hypothetical protein BKA65DRAFT_485024 [Rhexocercosporidium sp. MPI-PUGE-AT-0058]
MAEIGIHSSEDINVLKKKLKLNQRLSRESKGIPPAKYLLREVTMRRRLFYCSYQCKTGDLNPRPLKALKPKANSKGKTTTYKEYKKPSFYLQPPPDTSRVLVRLPGVTPPTIKINELRRDIREVEAQKDCLKADLERLGVRAVLDFNIKSRPKSSQNKSSYYNRLL